MFLSLTLFTFITVALAVEQVVNLDYASYQGTSLPNGITRWLGMRYAAAPVGNLRFAAPQDPLRIDGVQPAHRVSSTVLYIHQAELLTV